MLVHSPTITCELCKQQKTSLLLSPNLLDITLAQVLGKIGKALGKFSGNFCSYIFGVSMHYSPLLIFKFKSYMTVLFISIVIDQILCILFISFES